MMDKMGFKLNFKKIFYKYVYLFDKIDGLRIYFVKGFDKFF